MTGLEERNKAGIHGEGMAITILLAVVTFRPGPDLWSRYQAGKFNIFSNTENLMSLDHILKTGKWVW